MKRDEEDILKRGAPLVLRPKGRSWATLVEGLPKFTNDFMKGGRKQARLKKKRPGTHRSHARSKQARIPNLNSKAALMCTSSLNRKSKSKIT